MKRLLSLIIICVFALQIGFATGDTPSTWAKSDVDAVLDLNIIDARMVGDYQGEINRKDFAYLGVVIYEQITGKTASVGVSSFSDTTDDYVLRAKNVGIVDGYEDGSYKPYKSITRQELAKLFINTLRAANVNIGSIQVNKFSDDSVIADWAKDEVYLARSLEVVNGVGDNKYNPLGSATREQAILMFKRVIDKYTDLAPAETSVSTLKVGSIAPSFSVTTLKGNTISLGDLKGKPVVINFFTSWCSPCRQELDQLKTAHQTLGSSVNFIGVNILKDDNRDDVLELINNKGIEYPILLDAGSIKDDYGVESIPTTVILDAHGKVFSVIMGTTDSGELMNKINAAK